MNTRADVDLFIFDIAGTTVRDDDVVMRAFTDTAKAHDLRAEREWMRARMGWNKVEVFTELLDMNQRSKTSAAALADEFTARIIADMDKSTPTPLPGASESIAALRSRGVKVAFNTGYSAALAREIIGRVGWVPDAIIGSDLVGHGRPAPDMIRLAMKQCGITDQTRVGVAGDTPSDLAAGTAAGCRFVIGVGHGTYTLAELTSHPHTHLLPDLTTLCEILHVNP